MPTEELRVSATARSELSRSTCSYFKFPKAYRIRSMASSDVPGVVSCEWLKNALDEKSPGVVVLDVTWFSDKDARQMYNEKHIPGAQFFDIFQGATNTPTHNRNIPPPEAFEAQARAVGINADHHVIVYDQIPGKFGLFLGSRAWWMFRLHGHTKVSVLNGGLDKWMSLGFPATAETTKPQAGNFTVKFNASLIRQYDQMTDITKTGGQIMDTRPTESFKGQNTDARSGHAKGAVSTPFPLTFVDQSAGTVKSQDQLKEVFDSSGIKVDQPITGMCNGGMSSSTVALTAYLAGNKDVAVYLGGFNEWKQKSPEDLIERS